MREQGRGLVAELFSELDRRRIPHVVARRAELLDRLPPGDDIDLVVPKEHLATAWSVARQVAVEAGAVHVRGDVFAGSINAEFLTKSNGHQSLDLVRLHLQRATEYRGLELVSGEDLLRNRRHHVDLGGANAPSLKVYRPAAAAEAASLLLHDVVAKGRLRPSDLETIRATRDADADGLRAVLVASLGSATTAELDQMIASGDLPGLLALRGKVVRQLMLRQPLRAAWWHIRHAARLAGWGWRRRGALVVLVGPDGSGKTTLSERAVTQLREVRCKAERQYFGVTTPMLPTRRILRRLRSRKRDESAHRDQDMGRGLSTPRKFMYLLGTCHTLLDQWVRYWVQVRPQLARGRVLVCDRYFYDALISPAPAFFGRVLAWLVIHLSPVPDCVFMLTDDPAKIYARKPELTREEIARQQRLYARLLDAPIRGRVLAVSSDPTGNASRIARASLEALGARHG